MKFKKLIGLLLIFAICFMFTGCGKSNEKYTRFEDFEEKTIGVIEGTVHTEYVLSRIENANIKNYTDHELMVKDVKKGKIDGCVLDYPVAEYYEQRYSELAKFPSPLKEEEFCLYVSDSFNYYDEAYDIINKWKSNNELVQLQAKWFSGKKAYMKIDMSEYSNYPQTRGTLTAVVDQTSIPTSYRDKTGALQGYEVELIYKLAKELNLKPSIVSSDDFDGMIVDIKNKKYDMAAGVIVYNEERGKNGNFLPSTCEGGTYILTKKNKVAFAKKEKPQYAINTLDDLDGKKVGILAGSMFESFLTTNNVLTVNRYYPSQEASIEGVAKEEVVGAICDKEIAKNACKKNSNLTYVNVGYSEYGAIFSKNEEKLVSQYNRFLEKITMNGTLTRLSKKWSSDSSEDKIISDYKSLPNNNGVVKLATSSTLEPYAYILDNGMFGGFDVELVIEFCKEYGYALEINDTSCDNIFTCLTDGTCDIGAGAITKTTEREARFRFSNATGKDGIALVLLSKNSAFANGVRAKYTLGEQFYNVFVANDGWLFLLEGLGITLIVSLVSIVLGTGLGIVISLELVTGSDKDTKILSIIGKIIRRIPIVVWIAILTYFVFGGQFDTGIIIGIVSLTLSAGFELYDAVERMYNKFTVDDLVNGYNLGFDKIYSFMTSVYYREYNDVFSYYRDIVLRVVKNSTLLGLVYAFDFAFACHYVGMTSLVSWIPIFLMIGFYLSLNSLLEQLIERYKNGVLAKKKNANDFHFGTVSKFSLEDDSENVFSFKYSNEYNEYSKGLVGPIIRFENVKVDYDGRIGLEDINVEINRGECVAVAGPAKSGVTTFFNLVNGFIDPTEGKVFTFGKDTSIPELKNIIRKGVSTVLRSACVFPIKNVIENIMLVLINAENISKRKAYVKAYRLLFKFGLADKAFCYEDDLTVPEKKRLLLARALVELPEIVILDHIDEGLSEEELIELYVIISQLKESGVTILVSSDNFKWLQMVTNRMIILDEGKIIDDGDTESLVNRPEKVKTVDFVSKSVVFQTHITSKLFDHIQIRGKIWEFARNNDLSQEFVNTLVEIIGLIEKEVIIKVMPSAFDLNMKMAYTKPLNLVKLFIEYDGNDFDYINSMAVDKYDTFARMIEAIHYSYDGINKYEIDIPVIKN